MEGQYGHFVKDIPFTKGGPEPFECGALMEGSYFGFDNLCVRLGVCGKKGPIFEETDRMHTHDYDQHLFFFSMDVDDQLNLGGEVEISLGDPLERFKFDIPTTVAIPKGMPHFPAIVNDLKREIYFMSISSAAECKATPVETNLKPEDGELSSFRSKFMRNVLPMSWRRKNGYFYGSEGYEDSGGVFMAVDGSRTGLDLTVSWETIKKAHALGPRTPALTHAPHVHKFDEMLLFLGADSKNPDVLGGTGEICYGKEIEPYKVTSPVCTIFPINLLHCPLTFYEDPEKPFFFVVVSCAGAHH